MYICKMRRWSISKMFLALLCNYKNDQSVKTFKTCFETKSKDSHFQRLCVCGFFIENTEKNA